MFAQAVLLGVNLSSPVTWFVVAVAFVVLALTLSTRRGTARPRSALGDTSRVAREARGGDRRAVYLAQYSAAQVLFIEDPRAGLERARAVVASAVADRGSARDERYVAGLAVAERADATTEEMRQALVVLRGVLDEVTLA